MKTLFIEIQIPDSKIKDIYYLRRFIRKKLSAEYRIIQQRA